MIGNYGEQMSLFDLVADQDGVFGKTSPVRFHQEQNEEKTSGASWKKWQGWSNRESLFLDLRKESGKIAESLLGGGRNSPYSIAWRVLDAQHWGVPQRRRRISLVADFNGYDAPKVLFPETEYKREAERDSPYSPFRGFGGEPRPEVQPIGDGFAGDIEPGESEGESSSADFGESPEADDLPHTMQDRFPLTNYKADGESGGGTTFAIVGGHESGVSDMTNLVVGGAVKPTASATGKHTIRHPSGK